MENEALERPFAGWPGTVDFEDPKDECGVKSFRIVPFYRTPLAEGIVNLLMVLSVIAAIGGGLWLLYPGPIDLTWRPAVMLWCAAALSYWPVRWLLRVLVASGVVIEMTPQQVRILCQTRWRRYDRRLPVRFELHPHWKARKAALHRKVAPQRLREGFHIVLRYTEQAIVIANVYGERDARALFDRLNGCALVTAMSGQGGVLLDPRQQFRDTDDQL